MEEAADKKTSNVTELSLGLLIGSTALFLIGSRIRALTLPLWLLGATAFAGAASLRPSVTNMVGGIASEERLWIKLRSSVSIMRPAKDIYELWHNPLNWPKFMPDIDVQPAPHNRFTVTKRIVPGATLSQQIMIVEDLPYHRIAWVSLGEELPHRGSVEFTTNGGTYVTLTWEYRVAIGPAVNSLSKQTLRCLNEVLLLKLQRCKQIMEKDGATTLGPTSYKSSSAEMLWHVLKSDADRALSDLSEAQVSEV